MRVGRRRWARWAAATTCAVTALAVLVGCAQPTTPATHADAARPRLETRTFEVRPGLSVYTWTSPGRSHAPWIAYVHGGSWFHGRPDSPRGDAWARHEVARGYQVFGIEYRFSTLAPWPAQASDVAVSVDWVRAHAEQFGIAPDRAVLLGESAGGQLAGIEAARGHFDGVVDLAGVVDPRAALSAPFTPLRVAARRLLGCAPSSCPGSWRQARAITYLHHDAPAFLIVHSLHDPVVPVTMARDFAAQLRHRGVDVRLRVVPGTSHAPLLQTGVLRAVDGFLDRAVQ